MKPKDKVRVRHIDPKVRARIRRAVLRHKLDRRFAYTVFPDGSGCLATFEHYSVPCLGCTVSDKCRECGGHGYRQTWDLNKIEGVAIKIDTEAGDTHSLADPFAKQPRDNSRDSDLP